MKTKILLIAPTVTMNKEEMVKVPPILWIPSLAFSIIASFTPDQFEIEIVEEEIEVINFDTECDIVGISFMTAAAPRSYDIAREFKKRGKTIIFGGIHPTVLPEEAIKHCDSVIVGEAEGAWEMLLEDYLKGELKPIYKNLRPDLSKYPLPKRDLVKKKGILNVHPVITTRGCPYNCSFCCVPGIYGRRVRHIEPTRVVEDIINSKGKRFFFYDDNIIGYPKYAKQLFREMEPLKISWGGQASISFVKDEELMKLAQKSGCSFLFFGLETVSKSKLKRFRKNIKDINKLEESIKKIQDLGIHFHASLIFGFDDDDESIFDESLEFLIKNKVGSALFNILTPFPGTELYNEYKKNGRILTENWRYYDGKTVVYKPTTGMTADQLIDGYLKMKHEYYKPKSMLSRFFAKGNYSNKLFYLAMNLGGLTATRQQKRAMPIKQRNALKDVSLDNLKV